MILIYWIYQSYKYNGELNYGVALSKKQIPKLIISQLVLFIGLFLLYYFSQNSDTANSFAWQNILLYFRGILPMVVLTFLSDRTFRFLSNPTLECLIMAFIIDYIALIFVKLIKYKKRKVLLSGNLIISLIN